MDYVSAPAATEQGEPLHTARASAPWRLFFRNKAAGSAHCWRRGLANAIFRTRNLFQAHPIGAAVVFLFLGVERQE